MGDPGGTLQLARGLLQQLVEVRLDELLGIADTPRLIEGQGLLADHLFTAYFARIAASFKYPGPGIREAKVEKNPTLTSAVAASEGPPNVFTATPVGICIGSDLPSRRTRDTADSSF
jgi:hypothetical protein